MGTQLSFKEYRDKVKACFLGKNIGGTLGAPFECIRGVYDIDYYTHDLSLGVLPNDDLDLQLVWLNAAEQYGRGVDAEILGEYWLSYIVADWPAGTGTTTRIAAAASSAARFGPVWPRGTRKSP